jgi:hypothetical protein
MVRYYTFVLMPHGWPADTTELAATSEKMN